MLCCGGGLALIYQACVVKRRLSSYFSGVETCLWSHKTVNHLVLRHKCLSGYYDMLAANFA